MERWKKVEEFISPEALQRVKEVMGILGKEFPKHLDLYSLNIAGTNSRVSFDSLKDDEFISYAILLSETNGEDYSITGFPDLDNLGYFEFKKGYLKLVFKKRDVIYEWERSGNEFERLGMYVRDRFNMGHTLEVTFSQENDGLETSQLRIDGRYYGDNIKTDLATALFHGNGNFYKSQAPISEYYNFLKKLLRDPLCGQIVPYEFSSDEDKDMIARVFERPISDFLINLFTVDQSWRFERERQKAQDAYDYKKNKADSQKAIDEAEAKRIYDGAMQIAENEKKARESDIATKEEAYKSFLEKNAGAKLIQE